MISNFPEEFNTATGRPPPRPPITATTAIPISVTTTTRRPPRVKSNILANKKPSKSSFPFSNQRNKKPTVRPEVPIEFTLTDITDDRSKDPFRNPPLISADGKKPRVKSNLNFKHQNNFGGQGNNNNNGGGGGFHVEKPGLKASKKVPFDQNQFNFVPPAFEDQVLDYEVDLGGGNNINSNPGPEVRPDGRSPRVKSNIEALRKNQGRKVVNSPVRDTTESIFNLIPTGRPPLLTSRAPPPLAPAPTVEPTREEINQFSNFPPSFNSGQRPAGSPPRVKSNLNNANRNRPSFNNVVPQNELPGALGGVNRFPTSRPEPPPAFRQPPVTTPSLPSARPSYPFLMEVVAVQEAKKGQNSSMKLTKLKKLNALLLLHPHPNSFPLLLLLPHLLPKDPEDPKSVHKGPDHLDLLLQEEL